MNYILQIRFRSIPYICFVNHPLTFYRFVMNIKKIIFLFSFSSFACMLGGTFLSSCGDNGKQNSKVNYDSLPADLRTLFEKIDKDPANGTLYFDRAEYYFGHKKINEALADMKKASELDPNNVKFHVRLSDYYFASNLTRGTRDELVKVTQIDPKNNEALLKLGELYYLVKNYDTAVFYINRSISIEPENAKAYFEKGMALKEVGDSINAAAAFQSAVEKNTKYFDAYIQLANLYGAHKDKLAIQYYNNALKLDSNSKDALYGLGLFYQNAGAVADARATYAHLLRVDPKNAYAVYNQGYLALVLENKPKDAIAFFEKALLIAPEYADAVYMRGLCFEKLGDKKKAAADYNSALIIEPEHQLSIKGLQRLAGKK